MSKIIEAIYKNGVFKPLEKFELNEGEKVRIVIQENRKDTIRKYRGLFGNAKAEDLRKYEEEVMF